MRQEVLADLATPQGMEMFVKMMKIGASGGPDANGWGREDIRREVLPN